MTWKHTKLLLLILPVLAGCRVWKEGKAHLASLQAVFTPYRPINLFQVGHSTIYGCEDTYSYERSYDDSSGDRQYEAVEIQPSGSIAKRAYPAEITCRLWMNYQYKDKARKVFWRKALHVECAYEIRELGIRGKVQLAKIVPNSDAYRETVRLDRGNAWVPAKGGNLFFNGSVEISFQERDQVITGIQLRKASLFVSAWSREGGVSDLGKVALPRWAELPAGR